MKTFKNIMLMFLVIALAGAFASSAKADASSFGTATLRVGSSGRYVMALQTALNDYSGASLTADGHFGQMTKFAVEAFQRSHNLNADGAVGNVTRQILATLGVASVPASPVLPASTACTPVAVTSFSTGISQTTMEIPELEITGPTAGASYRVGDSIPVTWKNCNGYTGNVSIALVAATGQTVDVANNVSGANLGYKFTVPQSYLTYGVNSYHILLTSRLFSISDSDSGQSTGDTFTIFPNLTGAAPFIQSIDQVSGPVGTTVNLTGTGFLPSETVLFGGGPVPAKVNASGTVTTFSVPTSVGADCQPEAACPMYARLITLGSYPITVRNASGTSNDTSFTVTGLNQ